MIFSPRLRLALTLGLAVLVLGPSVGASVVRPPHGLPKILGVAISSRSVAPGQSVTARVVTSDNVRYVEARVGNYNQALTRQAAGKFALSYTVPAYLAGMPWLKHEWTLQIIARSVDGVEVLQRFPVRLR